jgi:membrane-associated phospholipid phosphatase
VRTLQIRLLALVALAALIRIAAYHVGPVQRADVRAVDALHLTWHSAPWRAASVLVGLFDPLPYGLIFLAVIGGAVWKGRARDAALAGFLILGAAATSQVLKHLLAAPRPQSLVALLPDDAWPSGHTTAATALGLALVLLAPPSRRQAVAIGVAVVVALVGLALVALGHHYPSDVLGGYCVAAIFASLAVTLSRRPESSASSSSRSALRRRSRAS